MRIVDMGGRGVLLAACRILLVILLAGAWNRAGAAAPGPADSGGTAPSPTAGAPADTTLEVRLQSAFGFLPELSGLEARVQGGVVRITGMAPSPEAHRTAVDMARSMPGVVYVDDRVEEATALGTRLDPTWEKLRAYFQKVLATVPLLVVALVIVVLFTLLARVVRDWQGPFRPAAETPLMRSILRQLAAVVIFLVGLYVGLELLGATTFVGAMLGAAGVVGIAVGFAFRDIVENYLASLILSVRQPFARNDHVRIDSFEGRVIRLTMRETVLMTLDGNHLRIPNALVFKSVMLNYTRNPYRRLDFPVGFGTGVDLAAAQTVGRGELASVPGVEADPPPFTRVEVLGDSTVTVRFFAWVDQRKVDFAKVRSEALRRVKGALEEAGLDMPVPAYQVQLTRAPRPGAPGAGAASPAPVSAAAEAVPAAHEVSVDHYLEDQIEADRRRGDDEDLLDPGGAP